MCELLGIIHYLWRQDRISVRMALQSAHIGLETTLSLSYVMVIVVRECIETI